VLCAEGYLFELERRGYLQAGAYVPEVVLDHPEVVAQLHREFMRAGSDVVEAFTYYGHREKLRLIGKEDKLEALQRNALAIATTAAGEGRGRPTACRRKHLEHDDLRSGRPGRRGRDAGHVR
jgi:betaine-homocysteine S-methyltransferase